MIVIAILLIRVKINNIEDAYTGDNLDTILSDNGIEAANVRSLEFIEGSAPTSYSNYPNLEDLITEKECLTQDLPRNMFNGNQVIRKVEIKGTKIAGKNSFAHAQGLLEVSLPSVVQIDEGTFYNSKNLKTINLPSVTFIGFQAFAYCPSLQTIHLPVVSSFGTNNYDASKAFAGCTSLISAKLDTTRFIPEEMFANTPLQEIYAPMTTSMGDYAFQNCKELKTLSFDMLQSFGTAAFKGCSLLTEVTMPSLVSIGDEGFASCTSLVKVNFEKVTYIGELCFSGCSQLTDVNIPLLGTLGEKAFSNCVALKSVHFPVVTKFGTDNYDRNGAFSGCTSLVSVKFDTTQFIPREIFSGTPIQEIYAPMTTSMGDSVFSNCKELKTLSFDSLQSIGASVFKGCSLLTEVTLPSLVSIGNEGFASCTSLVKVNFEKVTYIGKLCFAECSKLTDVNIPLLGTLGEKAFSNCVALKSVHFPVVTKFGTDNYDSNSGFSGCTSLVSVKFDTTQFIPESIFSGTPIQEIYAPMTTSIAYGAFLNCKELKTLSFDLLQSLGGSVFSGCSLLTEVTLPSLVSIGNEGFASCTSLVKVNFEKVTSIGKLSFSGCSQLTDVNMPLLGTLGEKAFSNCVALKSVHFPVVTKFGTDNYDSNSGFSGCTSLVSVKFDTTQFIPREIFSGTTIQEIYAPMTTSIADYAFQNCQNLVTIDFPELGSIGQDSFYQCTSLTKVSLPSCTYLGYRCFGSCSSLQEVHVPKASSYGTKTVSSKSQCDTFSDCTSLTTIEIPEMKSFGGRMFAGTQITKISNHVASEVEYQGFDSCTKLTEIDLPKVNILQEGAFRYCSGLQSIVLPELQRIGCFSFYGCSGLKSITINSAATLDSYVSNKVESGKIFGLTGLEYFESESLPYTRGNMFFEVSTLKTIKIPNCNSLAANTFATASLTDITVGTTTFSLSDFGNPTQLQKLTLTKITELQSGVLQSNTLLQEIHCPELQTVHENAFSGCTSLSIIDLPKVHTLVGDAQFQDCTNIQSLSLLSLTTVDPTAQNIFKGCIQMTVISLGSVPPKAFHPNVFDMRGDSIPITLDLPKGGLSRYDKSTDIEGDAAGDGYWCGIKLSGIAMSIAIDDVDYEGYSFGEIIDENQIAANQVTSIQYKTGSISEEEITTMKTKFPMLQKFIIPSNVRIVGNIIPTSSFEGHTALETIEISSPIILIGEKAFKNCFVLKTITLPSAISVGANAFDGIAATKIELPALTTIEGGHVFSNCPNLESIVLPALQKCTANLAIAELSPKIATITLPSTPPQVTSFTFSGTPKAILPKNNDYIAYDIVDSNIRDAKFYSLTLEYSMIKVSFNSKTAGGIKFSDALEKSQIDPSQIDTVIVTEGVLVASDFPLNIPSLRHFTVAAPVEFNELPAKAFENNNQLETISIQTDTTFTIGESAFKNCVSLQTADLKGATELKGDSHFEGCGILTKVSLPSLITVSQSSIRIFKDCMLTTLELGKNIPSFNKDTFAKMSVSLLLPDYDTYEAYDESLVVSGDKKGDSYWCGIKLPIRSFTVLINNEKESVGENINDAIASSGIASTDITSLNVKNGVLITSDLDGIMTSFPALKSFVVQNNVKVVGNLGSSVFAESLIEEVSISNLEELEEGAFRNCGLLRSVTMNNVQKVAGDAFIECPSLETVYLPKVKTMEGNNHFKNAKKLSMVDLSSLEVIQSGNSESFSGCNEVFTIKFPSTPPSMENDVFNNLKPVLSLPKLSDYTTYDQATVIEADQSNDFKWCSIDLVQLYMKVSVNSGDYKNIAQFVDTEVDPTQVTSINVNGGLIRENELKSGLKTFTNLNNFEIKKDAQLETQTIPNGAFSGLTKLRSVSIELAVSIGESAFEGCNMLVEVNLPKATSVYARAFASTALESITLDKCTKILGDGVFDQCASLHTVKLQNLIEIGVNYRIFSGCQKLKDIYLPKTPPKTFNAATFADCPLANIKLPNSYSYLAYDSSLLVEGDVANDLKWCGVNLPKELFPELIEITSDEKKLTGTTLTNAVAGQTAAKSIIIEKGEIKSDDLKTALAITVALEELCFKDGTISYVPAGVLSGENIKTLTFEGKITLEQGALSGLTALNKLVAQQLSELDSTAFEGLSMNYVDLSGLQRIPQRLLMGQPVETVLVSGATIVEAEAFMNCANLKMITLTRCVELIGDAHFKGCTSLENVGLSRLTFVETTSPEIFKDCAALSKISFHSMPPELFNREVFSNRGSDVEMEVILPSLKAWDNYIPQSELIDGTYYWMGIKFPEVEEETSAPEEESSLIEEESSTPEEESSSPEEIESSSPEEEESSSLEEEESSTPEKEEESSVIEEETPNKPSTPEEVPPPEEKTSVWLYVAIVFIVLTVVLAIALTVLAIKKKKNKEEMSSKADYL